MPRETDWFQPHCGGAVQKLQPVQTFNQDVHNQEMPKKLALGTHRWQKAVARILNVLSSMATKEGERRASAVS